jgi:hypothetical protein
VILSREQLVVEETWIGIFGGSIWVNMGRGVYSDLIYKSPDTRTG